MNAGSFEQSWCWPGFPQNRGEAEKIRVHANALLGRKFEPARIKRAAEDILAWWRENADWPDAMMQADWMTAAPMSLIAGEPTWTLELINEAELLNFYKSETKRLGHVARGPERAADSGRDTAQAHRRAVRCRALAEVERPWRCG